MKDHGLLPSTRYASRADFECYYFPPSLVVIIDKDLGNVSVTNDIENVVHDVNKLFHLESSFLATCVVLYRDSQGTWDEAHITCDWDNPDSYARFSHFSSVNETELVKAVSRAVGGEFYSAYTEYFEGLDKE